MDSTIDEFTRQVIEFRHTQLQPGHLRRVAQYLRDVVQPRLAEADRLEAENSALKQDLARAKKDNK